MKRLAGQRSFPLMLLHDARRETRLNAAGELVLLDEQDRARWDQAKIQEGIAVLDEALALSDPGPYQLQAAISALHAEAPAAEATDWRQIAALYGTLAMITPSLVIEVNRAVAAAMAAGSPGGAQAGLQMLLRLEGQADGARQVDGYYPYHAARADLLRRTNQREAAADAYERALALWLDSGFGSNYVIPKPFLLAHGASQGSTGAQLPCCATMRRGLPRGWAVIGYPEKCPLTLL